MQFDNQKTRNVADVVARILAGESAQVDEALKGDQHKIDANKNNKVDAEDFKILRAKKKMEEETELTESHFKVGDEVECKASGMEGEVVKVDPKQEGKYYTVKREDGKMVKYAPDELKKAEEEDEKEDMKESAGASKAKETKFHTSLDNLVHKTFGPSPSEKKEMKKEEVELDENSGGYEVKQSKTDPDVHHVHYNGKKIGSVYGNKKGMWGHEYHPMGTGDDGYSSKKEAVNAVKDDHKQHLNMKEEVELDEAMWPGSKEYNKKYGKSPQEKLKKKGDTVRTSQGEMTKTDKGVAHRRKFTEMLDVYKQGGLKTIAEMFVTEEPDNEQFTKEVEEVKKKATEKKSPEDEARVAKAKIDAVKVEEDVEQIDELSKSTLGSYAKKASHDARMKMAAGKDFERHAITSRKPEYKAGAKEWADKYKGDARRREAGVNKAIDRLAKEEVEQIDEAINHLQMAKHHQALAKEHDRISHKAAGWDQDDLSIAHTHQSEEHQDAAKAHLQAHKTGNPKDVKAAKKASKESLNNYTTHLMRTDYTHFYNVTNNRNSAGELHHKDYNYTKLRSGADAVRKGLKEEVEQIDEISQKLATAAYAKRSGTMSHNDPVARKKEDKAWERIGKRWGQKGQQKADAAADKYQAEEVELDEREMTDAEMKKREKIVKSMKKGLSGFKQRYGDRAKEVMYATATKQAMKD